METIKYLIEKIKETNYSELTNGKALKEIDFSELMSACNEIEECLSEGE